MTVDDYTSTGDDNRRMLEQLKKTNEEISVQML